MRKIATAEEIAKKKKRNATIVSMILLVIMVVSTIGYAFVYNSDDSNTNVDQTNSNSINYNGQIIYFSLTKNDVLGVNVSTYYTINNYYNSQVYVSGNNDAVYNEVYSVLGRFSSKVQKACYGKCNDDLPEKDCTENLIVWKDSGVNKVYQDNKCVFIEGDLRAVDAFLYSLFN